MNTKYIEQELIKLNKALYVEKSYDSVVLYGETNDHSSGFNRLEIVYDDDGKLEYVCEEESGLDSVCTLDDLIEVYPKITMNKEYAFYGKFVTWEELEKAFKGEMKIDFVRI